MSRVLVLPVMECYFREIQARVKTHEFRLRTPYWRRRLAEREYEFVEITLGYPRAGDESRRIRRAWRGCDERSIRHPHFGEGEVDVFAIDLSGGDQRSSGP